MLTCIKQKLNSTTGLYGKASGSRKRKPPKQYAPLKREIAGKQTRHLKRMAKKPQKSQNKRKPKL